jgi:hypothetical protein
MATPLNLYATKVFSEHPLGLWALDDRADYISFLAPEDQDLDTWGQRGALNVVDANGPEFAEPVPPLIPFPDIRVNGVIGKEDNQGKIDFSSPFTIQPSDINSELETFAFGMYVYSFSKIMNLRLGFSYKDPETDEPFKVMKAASLGVPLVWAMVSESFRLPESFKDLVLLIEISYPDDEEIYELVINGITAGQWAEEFQLKSFGTNLIDVPSSIDIPETRGIEAKPYGFSTGSGYYIADNNSLCARNLGIPLVYGARNSTYLTPKENSPSLIVPAFGFLNRSGQFNRLTAEFWIKIQSTASQPRRIFGPVQSLDGLYVDGPFLRLKIGKNVGSHYIKEWERPMLIDIKITPTTAVVVINGDEVISFSLNEKQYKFPPTFQNGKDRNWLGFYTYDDVPSIQLDCVGIYPYEVPSVVAKRRWVYGQGVQVPTSITGSSSSGSVFVDYPFAKYSRNYYFPSSSKWSNGNIENLVAKEDSIGPPDHPLPQMRFTNKTEKQWLEDLKNSQNLNSPKLTLRPTSDWENTQGHFFFKNLNFLTTQTRSFYGVFESKTFNSEPETLFEITNSINANSLKIYTQGDVLSHEGSRIRKIGAPSGFRRYSIQNFPHAFSTGAILTISDSAVLFPDESERPKSDFKNIPIYTVSKVLSPTEFEIQQETGITEVVIVGEYEEDPDLKIIFESTIYYSFTTKNSSGTPSEKIFYKTPGQKLNQKFFVGLDIPRFTRSEGKELATFLGTRQRLIAYVAGTQNLLETFSGDIHRIGFCTQRNLNKIQHLFNEDGIPVDYENVFDNFGPNVFDAGASYFEDNIDEFGNAISPPPAFWSLILDGGNPYDFAAITAEEHTASYTLVPKVTFEQFKLDVAIDAYWEDYIPLSYFAKNVPNGENEKNPEVTFLQFNLDYPVIKKFENKKFDTSKSIVRSYVAFQYLRSGSNAVTSSFTNVEPLPKDNVVYPKSEWMNTKYEVVNGTIIYPPSDVDINEISISVYLEFVIHGVAANPVKIRSLQLSSQSYGHSPNKIGTKFGTDLIPFSRSGKYFNYKLAPALSIYKESSPYLYNTSDSGIELKVPYSNLNIQGVSVPINESAAEFFKIGSVQLSLKYGESLFPKAPIKIFEMSYRGESISFFLIADSPNRKRGQIYAVDDQTGRIKSGFVFFENGVPVKRPVLYSNSWSIIGLYFPDFLDFGGFSGAIRFTSPIMFNNISYFQTSKSDDEERFGFRQWFALRSQAGSALDWGYWAGKELVGNVIVDVPDRGFDWQDVLFLSINLLREEINPSNIYNVFTGTDRIISEIDRPLSVGNYGYFVYQNLRWSSKTVDPV